MEADSENNSKELSLASLIVGLFFWMPLFNLLLSPIAIFLGIKAFHGFKRSKHHTRKHVAFASAGVLLGIIPMLFSLIKILMDLKFLAP